jgi:hypothetical protein
MGGPDPFLIVFETDDILEAVGAAERVAGIYPGVSFDPK